MEKFQLNLLILINLNFFRRCNVSLKIFKMSHLYIITKFPGKRFLGQYISHFYRRLDYSKRTEIQKKNKKKWHQNLHVLANCHSSLCSEDVSLKLFYPIPFFLLTGNVFSDSPYALEKLQNPKKNVGSAKINFMDYFPFY